MSEALGDSPVALSEGETASVVELQAMGFSFPMILCHYRGYGRVGGRVRVEGQVFGIQECAAPLQRQMPL